MWGTLLAALISILASAGGEPFAHEFLNAPAPWNPSATTLIYLRMQKTGSKTLVELFEGKVWLRKPCQKTNWIGQSTSSCKTALKARHTVMVGHSPCIIDGHCALDVLRDAPSPKLRYQPSQPSTEIAKASPIPPPVRNIVITLLREPTARTLSEFKHVCSLGVGQWDYSTRAWRSKNWALLPSADSEIDARDNRGVDSSKNLYASAVTSLNASTSEPTSEKPSSSNNSTSGGVWFKYDPRTCSSMATLVSFVVSKEHANGMDNRQVRMLAGAHLEPHAPDVRDVATELYPLAEAAMASQVDFVFVTEHFDLGLLLLAQRLGVPPPRTYMHVSEVKPQQPLPKEVQDAQNNKLETIGGSANAVPSAAPWIVAWLRRLNRFDATLHTAATSALNRAADAAGFGESKNNQINSIRSMPRGPFYHCTDVQPPRPLTFRPGSEKVTRECSLLVNASISRATAG